MRRWRWNFPWGQQVVGACAIGIFRIVQAMNAKRAAERRWVAERIWTVDGVLELQSRGRQMGVGQWTARRRKRISCTSNILTWATHCSQWAI